MMERVFGWMWVALCVAGIVAVAVGAHWHWFTAGICDDGGENRTILQTRAAFRGFVGGLTGLFNYRLDIAYGTWVDEDGFGHYEEEGGEE